MRTLLICAMLIASPAFAGQVFKCKDANGGTIFSPTPCGKGAQEVTLRAGTQGVDAVAPGVPQSAPTKVDAIRDISDGVADSHCRDDARNLYIAPSTSSLVQAQAELRRLEERSWVGGSASTRQILSETDQAHMASLRSLIATEQFSADATRMNSQKRVDEALAKCDVRKQEVEESRKHVN